MTAKRWIVTANDKKSITDLRRELEESGFKVQSALNEIGVIMASGTDAAARKVRKFKGVKDVAPDGFVDLGPGGSKDTW